jgi:murein DD-endopeptidase MepM/ murein hydrolase activator NlpD
MTWRVPIDKRLVPTTTRDRIVTAHETHLPLPPHPGAFAAKRTHHTHEGVDLYCPQGTPVFAVEPGEIVAIIPFTGSRAEPPSPWWRDTDAVLVEGASGVVVYGEIVSAIGRRVGDHVQRGEPVGCVLQVLTKDKGYPMSMLHLELHVRGTRYAYDWLDERPPSLLDPTPFLFAAHLEASLL